MNPFRKIANSLMNWWKGETAPEVSDSTELRSEERRVRV